MTRWLLRSIPAGAHGDPNAARLPHGRVRRLAAVGAVATVWPFINNLNPAADTLALSTIEVEL